MVDVRPRLPVAEQRNLDPVGTVVRQVVAAALVPLDLVQVPVAQPQAENEKHQGLQQRRYADDPPDKASGVGRSGNDFDDRRPRDGRHNQ